MYINGTRRVSTMRWNSKSSFFLSNFEVLTQSFLVSGIHSYQQVVDSVKTFSTFWLEKTLRRQTAKFHLLTLFSYSLYSFCLSQKYFIKMTSTFFHFNIPFLKHYIQLWNFDYKRLLNKPCVNEVTLSRQNSPLKCC